MQRHGACSGRNAAPDPGNCLAAIAQEGSYALTPDCLAEAASIPIRVLMPRQRSRCIGAAPAISVSRATTSSPSRTAMRSVGTGGALVASWT